MKLLFDLERSLKNVSREERFAARREKHARVVEELKKWCDHARLDVLDESPLTKAIGYATNPCRALRAFLDDDRLPLDNNWSERELRRIAWDRDN